MRYGAFDVYLLAASAYGFLLMPPAVDFAR